MLVPQGLAYWAQAGYIKIGTNNTEFDKTGFHYVAQYLRTNGSPKTFVGGAPGTSRHTYDVYLRAADDRVHMTRDGMNLLTLNYDTTGVWNPSWGGQWSAETEHVASDVPGKIGRAHV